MRDMVLEGVPTQDMLVLMEIEKYGLEETDFVGSLSTDQTRHHLKNLKMIAKRLHEMNPTYLDALIWQMVIGSQVNSANYCLANQLENFYRLLSNPMICHHEGNFS